jgi:hypothetical protein
VKRILLVLTVALVMVAMTAVTAGSAIAEPKCPGNPHCENAGGQPHGAKQMFKGR